LPLDADIRLARDVLEHLPIAVRTDHYAQII
jgi:hypothetical protein